MSSWLFCTYKLVKNWPGIHFGGFTFETIYIHHNQCACTFCIRTPPFPLQEKSLSPNSKNACLQIPKRLHSKNYAHLQTPQKKNEKNERVI